MKTRRHDHARAVRTDLMVGDTELANLAAACTQRMAERAESQALRQQLQRSIASTQSNLQLR